ncbi:hypothetical protein CANCADRAFT_95428 [Tortispora caseinolytica NRRL Y-17796]|uniref:Kinesin motor domain-containing protein n=1 Tax=Tortispora caseinolytica NRRL Y-17796 TaxID=767744 RepID=A0A1E4TMG1_9ASCO|nr:hypothetical protein CANCADRAFT_95428 [Tortispora caseinolytica NRRL Y-17796]
MTKNTSNLNMKHSHYKDPTSTSVLRAVSENTLNSLQSYLRNKNQKIAASLAVKEKENELSQNQLRSDLERRHSEQLQKLKAEYIADREKYFERELEARIQFKNELYQQRDEEYRKLKESYTDREIQANSTISVLRNEKETLDLSLQHCREELEAVKAKYIDQLNAKSAEIAPVESKLQEAMNNNKLLKDANELLEKNSCALKHEIKKLSDEAESLRRIIKEKNKALSSSQEDIERYQQELERLQTTLAVHQKQLKQQPILQDNNTEVSKLKAENDNLIKYIREKDNALSVLREENMTLKGNMRVFLRIRPPQHECETISYSIPDPNQRSLVVSQLNGKDLQKSFEYDKVFTPDCGNDSIFPEVAQLIHSAIDGYNVCILAYGQTGSGKTYTMLAQENSIMPKTAHYLFDVISSMKNSGWSFVIECQFLELYNETIQDLMVKEKQLTTNKGYDILHDEKSRITTIKNLTTRKFSSPAELVSALENAIKRRTMASTESNQVSSRSHAIFMIHINGSNTKTGAKTSSCLTLADLAGSERAMQSCESANRMRETGSINKSLSAFVNVIDALVPGNSAHIPYRNSKLTYLLKFFLGGSAKTLVLVNISPALAHKQETLSSLRFAEKVKKVKQKPICQTKVSD